MAASREKADEKIVRAGEDYDFGKVKVRVLWPTQKGIEDAGAERNNSSIVLLLTYGDTSLLLTGDAEKEAETQFVMDTQDVDLLRVGHHGRIRRHRRHLMLRVLNMPLFRLEKIIDMDILIQELLLVSKIVRSISSHRSRWGYPLAILGWRACSCPISLAVLKDECYPYNLFFLCQTFNEHLF